MVQADIKSKKLAEYLLLSHVAAGGAWQTTRFAPLKQFSRFIALTESHLPKLDDVSWHLEAAGEPDDTAEVRAGLHMGFFLAWVVHNGHWKGLPGQETAPIEQVRLRQMTGTQFLLEECDGKLFTDMLAPDMASGAERLYSKLFLPTYDTVLRAHGWQEYRAPDSWQFFDEVAQAMQSVDISKARKPWWRFW